MLRSVVLPEQEPDTAAEGDPDGENISANVAMLGGTETYFKTLAEAVEAVRTMIANGEEPCPIIVLQDCTVSETIQITEGINIFGAKENEQPIMPTITAEGVPLCLRSVKTAICCSMI